MTKENDKDFLNITESKNTEILQSCDDIDLIGRLICGFLNALGGEIICGIDDKKKIIGITNSENTIKTITDSIDMYLKPISLYDVSIHNYDGKDLVIIRVPMGNDKPYGYKDVIYTRIRNNNVYAGVEYIRDIIMTQSIKPERWERRLSLSMEDTDLNIKLIKDTVSQISVKRGFPFKDKDNPYSILEDLSLARYGNYTQGGDVLFSNNPEIRFPQVRVRVVHYADSKVSNTFLENDVYAGPLMVVLSRTLDFIVRNIPSLSTFYQDKLTREDLSVIPIDALREGLVNAFVHRDYAAHNGGIRVSIYPDRLEIWNSGRFPKGITPDKMSLEHPSILNNPDISLVFYLCEYMDQVGRGSFKIIDACKFLEYPPPVWESHETTGVTLTISWKLTTTEDTGDVTTEDTGEVTMEVMKLCKVIKGNMSREDIQDGLNLKSDEHVRLQYISPALKAGYIEMTIPDKPTSRNQKYRLTKKGTALLKEQDEK